MTIVVKIGGSLTRAGPPVALLRQLAERQGIIVVPGGGAFADAVRGAQPALGLTDSAAHRMALLAMEQMAHAMADLAPALRPAQTLAALGAAAEQGTALWFPAALTIGNAEIRESWDVTSDSLALWLATRLAAPRLLLVKAPGAAVPAASGTLAQQVSAWTAAGLVDAAFATLASRFAGDIVLVPADDADRLAAALGPGSGTGGKPEDAKEAPAPP